MPKQVAKQITANNAVIVQEFKPTPHMIVWLDTAIKLLTDSPTKISAENEQRRENFYDWLKIPGFEEWFYTNYKNKRQRLLPTLDEIGMTEAKKGKFDFWKEMRVAAGDVQDKDPKVQVNILNAIQEQKNKYGI